MKILHLSDLHIGKKVNGYSMIDDQKYILNQILEKIDLIKPEVVFIAGDVYDKSIPPIEAVELFDEFLTQLVKRKIKVFMIYGNHDSAERVSFADKILKNNDVYISPVFDGTVKKVTLNEDCGIINIYLLPFLKPIIVKKFFEDKEINNYNDAVKVVIDSLDIDKSQINIILAHQYLTGSQVCESEELAIGGLDNIDVALFDDFDYVALGHLHKAQKVQRETVRYSGTPLKYSISEKKHKKSITIIDVNSKNDLKITLEDLKPKRDVREIIGKYKKILEESYIDENKDDYMSIVLTDEEDIINAPNVLSNIYKNIMKISYDNKRTKTNNNLILQDNVEQKSMLEIFDDLYSSQNGDSMSDKQKDFLKRLLDEVEEI